MKVQKVNQTQTTKSPKKVNKLNKNKPYTHITQPPSPTKTEQRVWGERIIRSQKCGYDSGSLSHKSLETSKVHWRNITRCFPGFSFFQKVLILHKCHKQNNRVDLFSNLLKHEGIKKRDTGHKWQFGLQTEIIV